MVVKYEIQQQFLSLSSSNFIVFFFPFFVCVCVCVNMRMCKASHEITNKVDSTEKNFHLGAVLCVKPDMWKYIEKCARCVKMKSF